MGVVNTKYDFRAKKPRKYENQQTRQSSLRPKTRLLVTVVGGSYPCQCDQGAEAKLGGGTGDAGRRRGRQRGEGGE